MKRRCKFYTPPFEGIGKSFGTLKIYNIIFYAPDFFYIHFAEEDGINP